MMGSATQMQSPKEKFEETSKKTEVRRKLSIHQSNKKYDELLSKKMKSNHKIEQLKRNLEETSIQEF